MTKDKHKRYLDFRTTSEMLLALSDRLTLMDISLSKLSAKIRDLSCSSLTCLLWGQNSREFCLVGRDRPIFLSSGVLQTLGLTVLSSLCGL